ncbi:MAG: Dna2/Cas4 domain-containing protein, partial [Patescibacteria group bacterium]|nr:Dna2/Cas4 domain-containing protein [Patescibacteria group bacterium]
VLEQKGNQSFVGQLDYPLLKTSKKIKLTEQNRKKMTSWIKQIKAIILADQPLPPIRQSICKKCSYYEYCYS